MHELDIRFTGSGSEYFRIWIVNLLLIFVTLGLYYPWAKARRLRYFHQNTQIGNDAVGRFALDFHGRPTAMLRGQLLAAALFVAYSVAGQFSALAALLALGALAALAPLLWCVALSFRLTNTSWRGLRMRFTGSVAQAYRAVAPMYAPILLLLALPSFADVSLEQPALPPALAGLIGSLTLLCLALAPWWLQRIKRYQHRHYAYGQLASSFDAGAGAFYAVAFKTMALALALMLVAIALLAALGLTTLSTLTAESGTTRIGVHAILFAFASIAIVALFQLSLKPFLVSRLQNLVWSHTRNERIAFDSRLRWLPLTGLTVKNWLLIVATLGLYWPFAAVALARLRLSAVTVRTGEHPDDIVSRGTPDGRGALGDAATDLFGFDVGL